MTDPNDNTVVVRGPATRLAQEISVRTHRLRGNERTSVTGTLPLSWLESR